MDFSQRERFEATPSIRRIIIELSRFATLRAPSTLQFSFATKMAATIAPKSFPIYDRNVAKMFDFEMPANLNAVAKLQLFMDFYKHLGETVQASLQNKAIIEINDHLASKSEIWSKISRFKQVDFILWMAGRLT